MLNALIGVIGFVSKLFGWLTYRRTKNVGKLEAEVERLREESDRAGRRKEIDADVDRLPRADIVKRLRRFKRPNERGRL